MDDRGIVRIPAGARDTSPFYIFQTGCKAHSMGTADSFADIKRPGREADHSFDIVPR
jgi:hypothetical protein